MTNTTTFSNELQYQEICIGEAVVSMKVNKLIEISK